MPKNWLALPAVALVMLSFSLPALSGDIGTITYGPGLVAASAGGVQSVPLLGGLGLVVLSALLALISVRVIKDKHRGGGTWLVVATMAAALSSAGGGFKLISDAHAGVAPIILDSDSGGVVGIPAAGLWDVRNEASTAQTILGIVVDPGCFVANGQVNGGQGGFVGNCEEGSTRLEPTEICSLDVVCCQGPNGGNQGGNPGCPF